MSATVTIGNVTYTLTSGSYTASVTGNALEERTNVTIPSTITDPDTELPYTVTSIGNQAFNNSPYLASIVIPETVTIIANGSSPYYGAFMYCSALTAVTIGANVTSIGEGAFYNCSELTAVTIPDAVTSIGYVAFARCSELTAVIIGSSVTTIGHEAFIGCRALTAVIIPDAVTSIGINTFTGCIELTAVTIGSSVTTIGDFAFGGCTELTSMYFLGDLPSSLGSDLFLGDDLLTLYYLDGASNWPSIVGGKNPVAITAGTTGVASITNFNNSAKTATFSIANTSYTNVELVVLNGDSGVTSGKAFALSGDNWTVTSPALVDGDVVKVFLQTSSGAIVTQLLSYDSTATAEDGTIYYSVDLGVGIVSIGNNAFYLCSALTAVTIGANVTSIGNDAFRECSELTAVIIPDAVTSIGQGAFFNCSELTAVTIGASVTSIGDYAFAFCIALTAVTISYGNTTFFNGSNGEVYQISDSTVSLFFCPRNVTSFTIPDSVTDNVSYTVTSIGYSAFDRCIALTAVTIGANVTSIGDCAFNECSELTGVTIPDAVTSIGGAAFQMCSKLTFVTIGSGLTTMGSGAFQSCGDTLKSMYFLGDYPSGIDGTTFYGDNSLTLYYVDGVTSWPSIVGNRPAYPIPTITSATTPNVSISADSDLSTVYVYTSTNSGFTWTTNSVTMSSGYGTLSNLSSGTLVSTIANIYDAATYADYCKTVTTSTPTPSSNVCFPAKTPIMTNCGPINIEDIDPSVHTIRNKKIVAITKTVAHDKNLVRIAKHALGHLYPEKTTLISQNHKVFFQGQMVQAKYLVDEARGVTLVPYKGQVLYNVLLEQYEKMQVNNLIVETLHPENKVAKLYRFLQNVDAAHHGKLIALFNKKDKEQRLRF